MPYLEEWQRPAAARKPITSGELNYAIHQDIAKFLFSNSVGYTTFNEVIGVLECVKQEFYRRLLVPYEDKKRQENGDVRPYS